MPNHAISFEDNRTGVAPKGWTATLTGTGTTYADAGLAAGTYTYTVTNASGCVSPASSSLPR